jgi:hypothetical protein
MRPGEYEAILQARLAEVRSARSKASARRAGRARQHPRGRVRPRAAGLLALAGALVLGATAAIASHGGTVIDLTIANEIVEHQDAVFIQGGLGAGTGNFDPFLTVKPSPQSPTPAQDGTEDGYNQCDDALCPDDSNDSPFFFDQFFGGGRTHELLVSAVPIIEFEGSFYREFSLDANDEGADSFMSVDDIRIFLDDQDNLDNFNPGTNLFGNDTGTVADKVFDLDMPILLETQTLEPGSGVSDITVLLPVDIFPEECFYGSLDCDTFLIFYAESGHAGTIGDRNYDVTAGFEEWRIQLLPVVNVEKTADVSLTRTFPWDVAKEADGEPDVINLFAGDTATIDWTVTATVGTPVDSDLLVSGTITITNPTGGDVIQDDIPATINSVTDILTQGLTDTPLTVICPETFPFTLGAQDELVCTYSGTPPNSTNGTNTATANIDINETDTADYSGTAPVDFGAADVTEVDACIEVTDDNATPGDTSDDLLLDAELCEDESPGVYPFSTDVGPFDVADCGQTTITNTAYTETNDTATQDSASDSVVVNCYELTVSKTAVESFSKEYDWTIQKSVDPETLDLFDGDSDTVDWLVEVFRDEGTAFGWAVSGVITINNPAPIAADDVSVADSISGVGAATVDCDAGTLGNQTTVDIAASSSAQCSYSATLPDGATRTNTATATLFDEDYTGTAEINFTGVNPTLIDETATVTDDRGPLNESVSDDDSFTYPETFECGDDEGTHDNTAVVTEDDTAESDDDDASVTVNCYQLTVDKDANTSLDRDYDWEISKTRIIVPEENDGDGDPTTLTLDEGQTYTVTFEVTVNSTGFTDSNWAVEGTITVTNPAPILADDVVVTDVISVAIPADVDCDPGTLGNQNTVDIPANDSVDCTYGAALPDGTDRSNTATATLFGIGYDGSADVLFDENTDVTEIDECIDVWDDKGTADTSDDVKLGTVCIGDGLTTFTYTTTIGPFAVCGLYEFTNTASFLTTDDVNDTDESGSATYTIFIDVPCPQGCTLTWGYWKTHNVSFWGGAPPDPTWELLGDVDGDGTEEFEGENFFLSDLTYFEVLTTPVAGNAYFNLAHQYIATQLNFLDGADPTAAQDAFDDATALFETYTDEEIAALKGKIGKELRAQFITLAGILGSYNEGDIGPGHCDEDPTSRAGIVMFPLGLTALLGRRLRRRS